MPDKSPKKDHPQPAAGALRAPEVIVVDNDTDEVCCDGGSGPLGHPQVWYSFHGRDKCECHYCDRAFVKKRAVRGSA